MVTHLRAIRFIALVALFLLGIVDAGWAQWPECEGKTSFARRGCELQQWMLHSGNGKANNTAPANTAAQSLTSGLNDVIRVDTLAPSVGPKTYRPLSKLERSPDGAFLLKRGFFEVYVESYYFENPNNNSAVTGAFFPAPIEGERGAVIAAVLKQAEQHPQIKQPEIEQLLLAIFAGTPLEKMPQQVQQTAVVLLPADTAKQLSAAAQAKSSEQSVMNLLNKRAGGAASSKPQPQPATVAPTLPMSNQDGEGGGDQGADLPAVRGTWTQMPGGFYVRYLPEGWSRTRIQVMVPDAAITQADAEHPLTFDPTQYLAVLAQPPAQRLGISLRQIVVPAH